MKENKRGEKIKINENKSCLDRYSKERRGDDRTGQDLTGQRELKKCHCVSTLVRAYLFLQTTASYVCSVRTAV